MNFNKKDLFLIPNILTYARLLCVPFFIWIILDNSIPNHEYIAFGLFMAASFTDIVDGLVARQFNMTSDIGKLLDPLADKLLQVSTLFGLTAIGKIHWVFPLIFAIKEFYLVFGGFFIINAMKSNYVLQSNFFGKSATWLNSLGIVLAFFVNDVNESYNNIVTITLSIGAAFAIITAIIYTIQFFKYRKEELSSGEGVATTDRLRAKLSRTPEVGECGELRDELCGKCSDCECINNKCDKTLKNSFNTAGDDCDNSSLVSDEMQTSNSGIVDGIEVNTSAIADSAVVDNADIADSAVVDNADIADSVVVEKADTIDIEVK